MEKVKYQIEEVYKDSLSNPTFVCNGKEFKTLDELVMYIAVAFDENTELWFNFSKREYENKFVELMRKLCVK